MAWVIASFVAYIGSTGLTLWLIRCHLLRMRAEVREIVAAMLRESIRQAPQHAIERATELAGAFVDQISDSDPPVSDDPAAPDSTTRQPGLLTEFLKTARATFGAGKRRE